MATTPPSALVVWKPPAGFGLGVMLQCEPFQCSIRVLYAPPVLYEPTAQASLADVAATALRVADPRLGLDTTVHPAQARGAATAGVPAASPGTSSAAAPMTVAAAGRADLPVMGGPPPNVRAPVRAI